MKNLLSGLLLLLFCIVSAADAQEQGDIRINKLHVSLGRGWTDSSHSNRIVKEFKKSGLARSSDEAEGYYQTPDFLMAEGSNAYWFMTASYSVHPRVRAGISFTEIPIAGVYGSFNEYEAISGVSIAVTGEYIIVPPGNSFMKSLELTFGGGSSWDIAEVTIQNLRWYGSADHHDYKETHYVPGFIVRGNAGHYFSQSISFGVMFEARFTRGISIPPYRFEYQHYFWDEDLQVMVTEYSYKTLNEHTLHRSSLSYAFYLKVHL